MIDYLKKIALTLIVIALIAALFWPSGRDYSDGKIHIEYWYATGQKEELPLTVRLFNQMQDSIVVDAVAIPWQESEKKILTAILSENPPEVIDHFAPVVKWAARMGIRPLDDLIQEDQFDSTVIFPASWREMQWQGHTFAMPTATASYALFYNKRLFRQAGLDPDRPPRTWDEVIRYSEKLLKKNAGGQIERMGFIFHHGRTLKISQQTEEPILLMAWQKGISFIDRETQKLAFANPRMYDILDYVKAASANYDFAEFLAFTAGFGYGDQHAFTSERVAMMILPSSFPANIARYNPDLDYGITMIPSFEDCPTASSTATWWMAIPRHAKHPRAAWAFLKFAVEKETQLKTILANEENLFPANRLAARDSLFLSNSGMAIFLRQLEFAHSTTIVPLAHDVFWREFTSALERVAHGSQEPEQALKQAQKLVQTELDDALQYDRYVRANMEFWRDLQ